MSNEIIPIIMPSFHQRLQQKEQLDDLDLNGERLHQTLDELAFINRFLGNYWAISKAIFKIVEENPQSSYRIIDLGCGGGDVLRYLAKKFQQKGLQATFLGIDGNENSLFYARKKVTNFSTIEFTKQDILSREFNLPACDILIASHFFYHFEDDAILPFIERIRPQIRLAFFASELERNQLAYYLFRGFTPFLFLSQLTRQDGATAIRRAFTKSELQALLKGNHSFHYHIQRKPLFRLLLTLRF